MTVVPGYYADAAEACRERERAGGALVMHPYDQPEVVAGQGTIGIELDAQVPDAETVLVAVGGGWVDRRHRGVVRREEKSRGS